MKIGLIDVDSHNWPNLCLMKLSAYHKARGDLVEWWNPGNHYDLVYKSRVFTDTYSKDTIAVTNADAVISGGTGYGIRENLPDAVEHTRPDASLYPQFSDTAYGFLSRGCPRNCGFCIVSGKEGRKSRKVADLSEFWDGQREIKLLDANLLACPDHRPFGTSCWMNATLALMSWAGNRWSRWGAAGYGTVMKANGSGFPTTIRPSSAKSCSSGCRN